MAVDRIPPEGRSRSGSSAIVSPGEKESSVGPGYASCSSALRRKSVFVPETNHHCPIELNLVLFWLELANTDSYDQLGND